MVIYYAESPIFVYYQSRCILFAYISKYEKTQFSLLKNEKNISILSPHLRK
jgi:hypothetical protein